MEQKDPLNLESSDIALSPRKGLKSSKWKWVVGVVVASAIVTGIFYFKLPEVIQDVLKGALDRVAELGVWGMALFAAIYIVASICLIPGSILTLGAGALFGVLKGAILASISATLGATAAFVVGRYLARDWVAKKIEANPKFKSINRTVEKNGWKIVAISRLVPILPYPLLNYAFGLTRVSLREYVSASWIGMIPGTVMYVYIGSLVRYGANEATPSQWKWRGIGVIAAIIVVAVLTYIARRAARNKSIGKSKAG